MVGTLQSKLREAAADLNEISGEIFPKDHITAREALQRAAFNLRAAQEFSFDLSDPAAQRAFALHMTNVDAGLGVVRELVQLGRLVLLAREHVAAP